MEGYNKRALKDLRAWARDKNSHLDVGCWARITREGTFMCLAARTVVDFGAELVWEHQGSGVSPTAGLCIESGKLRKIPELAKEILGLTTGEANVLFDPDLGCVQDDECCSLAFLDFLILRAELNERCLATGQPEGWKFCWAWANVEPAEAD